MATRPISAGQRGARVNWRAALRRSLRRSAEIGGALVLLGGMVFLALAMVSYHQTDPSASTAAGGPVENWMGDTDKAHLAEFQDRCADAEQAMVAIQWCLDWAQDMRRKAA